MPFHLLPVIIGSLVLAQSSVPSVTLESLRAEAQLTPDRFARHFRDFAFELGEQIQAPETFLSRRKGDCDDYATLAATILAEKGYSPKLVVVFMEREIHAVCFIRETSSYLDFNHRQGPAYTVPSNGALNDIAGKVASAFGDKWFAVGEFTWSQGERRIGSIDFPQQGATRREG